MTAIIKTWTKDFKYFHWLAEHRQSVHIPAVPNMVKKHVSNKASFAALKKMAAKNLFGPELAEAEIDALVDNTWKSCWSWSF